MFQARAYVGIRYFVRLNTKTLEQSPPIFPYFITMMRATRVGVRGSCLLITVYNHIPSRHVCT